MAVINRIFYYGFILPLSLLPFPVLYLLSDLLYVLMYYVVGYRKKVVMTNLKNSFPEKSKAERIGIAKKFYRHFCDLTLESLKNFTISDEDAKKRMVYFDEHVANKYFEQGKSVIVTMAHYNNWELVAITVAMAMKHKTLAIYKPLTSKYFDKKMLDSRQKYGLQMVHNWDVKKEFEATKDQLTAWFFLIDQAPSAHSKPYWMTFLNQDTGVLTGTEKYAKEYNYPVLFLDIRKPKRGYYTCRFVDITDQPNSFPEAKLMEVVTRRLEEDIRREPQYWLWSHRRWKRKRPTEAELAAAAQAKS